MTDNLYRVLIVLTNGRTTNDVYARDDVQAIVRAVKAERKRQLHTGCYAGVIGATIERVFSIGGER
jgi:hypothetical protein